MRKYPDLGHLSGLEEELGVIVDDDFLDGQRAMLHRIHSERTLPSPQASSSWSASTRSLDGTGTTNQNIADFLADPGEVQEQRAILQRIQASRNQNQIDVYSKSYNDGVERLCSDLEEAAVLGLHHNTSARTPTAELDLISAGSPSTTTTSACFSDCVGRFHSGGKKVRIKGTSHVYAAIADGTAIIVHCQYCDTVLQVGDKTKEVFCCVCRRVSPVEGNVRSTSSREDREIASHVQEQEIDVACARIQSKLARG
jgi:hypothetical protein